jgi:hypothetical protein
MKLCIDCKHFEAAKPLRWYEMFTYIELDRAQDKCNNVPSDMVTGEPRQKLAQYMRYAGCCGRDALLFEPKSAVWALAESLAGSKI